MSVGTRDPFAVDPALVERGLRGHARTQNALATFARSRGGLPRSPRPEEPNFDLAWELHGVTWVAEVKSITDANEEKQLRLGLGQVLRYRQLLRRSHASPVKCAVVCERRPSDETWAELFEALGVQLVWPEAFARLSV